MKSDMKTEWISVKDKLPGEGEIVLMYHDGEFFVGIVQIVYSDGFAVFKEISGGFNYSIPASHWMPLPEPPTQ